MRPDRDATRKQINRAHLNSIPIKKHLHHHDAGVFYRTLLGPSMDHLEGETTNNTVQAEGAVP